MSELLEFSIVTMNMRFGLARDGKNGWFNRKYLVQQLLYEHPKPRGTLTGFFIVVRFS